MLKHLIGLLLFAPILAAGQKYETKDYKWAKKPKWEQLEAADQDEASVTLMDKRIIEYIFDDNEELVMFETKHKKIRVNTGRAIENHNKVFIPLHDVMDLVDLRARTVTKKGKVIEVDKKNIKDLSNVEEYGPYKIFAIEGLEEESDVEYYYTLKKQVSYFGRQTFQNSRVVRNASLEIISPQNLVFISKSYNDFPELREGDMGDKRILRAEIDRIPPMKQERYAPYQSNLMRTEFKVSHNTQRGSSEMLTWSDASSRFTEMIYDADDKVMKKVGKLVEGLSLQGKGDADKIKEIENYLKNDFTLKESLGPGSSEWSTMLKEKATDSRGMVKLFAAFFDAANIVHELVLTTDRYEARFDGEFMSWNYLDKYLFYFPILDQYLIPDRPDYRFGVFPFEYSANKGLFISRIKVGEKFVASSGKVKFIDELDMDRHYDNLNVEISLTGNMQTANLNVQRIFAGHNAMFIQPYYDLIPEKDRNEAVESLLKFVGEDAQVENQVVNNHNKDTSPVEAPLELRGTMKVNSLIERAGNDFLFKIGNVIGAQVEMYQDDERQNDVELDYPHKYLREITFLVPDGYELDGLDNLNMDIEYGDGREQTMGFKSTYEFQKGKLYVRVEEYYKRVNYPIGQFEDFRKVINAAADFNKIVLVLRKASEQGG